MDSEMVSLDVIDIQTAAVRTINRAQWFLISFPMGEFLRSREVRL